MLVERGADVNLVSDDGVDPLFATPEHRVVPEDMVPATTNVPHSGNVISGSD